MRRVDEGDSQRDLCNSSLIKVTLFADKTLLKATIGNCQRPVFSLAVSQHMHKITNLCKFELKRSTKLQDNNERKNTLVTQSLEIKFVENYFFLENYISSEGAVSHNVLYYQLLPITRYQVSFYANNYFE